MNNPRMTISGIDNIARRNQLAYRVEGLMALNCTCEELFNKCHGAGGKFCGTGGSRKPAPVDYVKEKIKTAESTYKGRRDSASIEHVTTGGLRRVVSVATFIPLSTSYGSVKIKRLSRTKLDHFTIKDLHTIKKALTTDQRRYNLMGTFSWANAGIATAAMAKGLINPAIGALDLGRAATALGLSRWKTKRIPGQIERVDREIKRRQGPSLAMDAFTFATEEENLPSLKEEIVQARKDIESGKGPKDAKLTSAQIAELGKMIDAMDIDTEEGVTVKMIKDLHSSLDMVKS